MAGSFPLKRPLWYIFSLSCYFYLFVVHVFVVRTAFCSKVHYLLKLNSRLSPLSTIR